MPERHSTRELFYGYADWLIADWCAVSVQTARHWKSGIRKPGPSSVKLFMLHRDGRVLEKDWEGFTTRRGKLVDPEGHEIDQAQLRVWPWVWQLAAEYANLDPTANDFYRRAISRLDQGKSTRSRREQPSRRSLELLLPRVTPDPSTLRHVIIPRTTRKHG